MTNKRLQKTFEKLRTLHNCNNNTIIDGAFYDKRCDEIIILFTNKREYVSPITNRKCLGTFNEYVYFNKNYTWLCRVGYFCGVEEQLKHFNSLENLEKVF